MPKPERVRFNRLWDDGKRCFREGDFALALRSYREALAVSEDARGDDGTGFDFWLRRLWSDIAGAQCESGELAAALESIERSFAVGDGYFPTRHHNKGEILRRLGRAREALQCFDDAIAETAGTYASFAAGSKASRRTIGDSFCGRGQALVDLGRPAEALEAFDRALGLNRDCLDAWEAREKLLRAAGRTKEADKARVQLERRRRSS
jgi:tetratricopeptide (TPR) repeat protein